MKPAPGQRDRGQSLALHLEGARRVRQRNAARRPDLLRISTIESTILGNDKRDDGLDIADLQRGSARRSWQLHGQHGRLNAVTCGSGSMVNVPNRSGKGKEATFHRSLGLASEIRNPRAVYYTWDQEDILNGLQCNS